MASAGSPIVRVGPYAIVGSPNLQGLSELVNKQVADGYEPIGSPFKEILHNGTQQQEFWCQAIFKRPILRMV